MYCYHKLSITLLEKKKRVEKRNAKHLVDGFFSIIFFKSKRWFRFNGFFSSVGMVLYAEMHNGNFWIVTVLSCLLQPLLNNLRNFVDFFVESSTKAQDLAIKMDAFRFIIFSLTITPTHPTTPHHPQSHQTSPRVRFTACTKQTAAS